MVSTSIIVPTLKYYLKIPRFMNIKKEIKPILVAILFIVMLSVFVDFLYPLLKQWVF